MKQEKLIVLLLFVILLVVGCNSPVTQEELIEEISIEELAESIEYLKIYISELDNELNTNLFILNHLIEQLPGVIVKQGYIKEVVLTENDKYFVVDYATFVPNDFSSPNGFHIKNEKEEKIKVKFIDELQIFTLEEVFVKSTTLEELHVDERLDLRFFDFYFVNSKLVLVKERYIP